MEIPVLVHGKGIYNSGDMEVKCAEMILEGSRIREMDSFGELGSTYPGVRVMDLSGCYTLPGLVNTHVYLGLAPCRDTYGTCRREDRKTRLTRAAEYAGTFLRSGVTTIRDAGSSMGLIGALWDKDTDVRPGIELPRIQTAGMPLTPDRGHLVFLGRASNSTEGLIQAVKEQKSVDCGRVKLTVSGDQLTLGLVPEYDSHSREEIHVVVEVAHELGLLTAAHCLTTSSYINAMEAEVDSVEHYACFRRNPSLELSERCYEPDVMKAFHGNHRCFMIGISDNYHQLDRAREDVRKPDERGAFLLEQEERECEIFDRLVDLEMRPLVRTDAGCGYTFFDETWLEMELLCSRYVLTPKKVIYATTLEGVGALGWGDFLGRLAPGYEADSIAAEQNLLRDIKVLRYIRHVVRREEIIE